MDREAAMILEYETIKQEIFALMSRIDQLLVIEYTVSIAFLGIGFEKGYSLAYILVFLFMIPIQEMINSRRRHMARASAYIEVIIEMEIPSLKWEKSVAEIDTTYNQKHLEKNFIRKGYSFLTNNASLMIALVAFVLYLRENAVIEMIATNAASVTNYDIIGTTFLVVCLIIIIIQSIMYSKFGKLRETYKEIIGEINIGRESDSK